jgi:hypothetical protein
MAPAQHLGALRVTSSNDFDFEDLLESFERKFAKKLANRAPPTDLIVQPSGPRPSTMSSGSYNAADFQIELQLLLAEVHQSLVLSRQTSPDNGNVKDSGASLDSSIGREVLRSEIRATMEKLRRWDEKSVDDASTDANSSQRASIASLKRCNREANEELERLRRFKKQGEVKVRNMQDLNAKKQGKISLLEEKIKLIEIESHEMDNRMRDSDNTVMTMSTDKRRLERSVAMLRTELLDSHHRLSEQKLLTTQSERRVKDLEARASEMRNSEQALAERVKELHEVQGQMLEEMKKIVDSKDLDASALPAARRALQNLSDRRSRIVGKIASIMTRRNAVNQGEDGAIVREESSSLSETNDDGVLSASTSPIVVESQCSTSAPRSNDEDGIVKKPSLLGGLLRMNTSASASRDDGSGPPTSQKSGSGFANSGASKVPTSKQVRAIYESNLVLSRETAERDSDTLREVLENKSSEIERLENELKDAKEGAARYERELQSERQHRRKENRNLHNPQEEEARREMSNISHRSRVQSLFDWQSSNTQSEERE